MSATPLILIHYLHLGIVWAFGHKRGGHLVEYANNQPVKTLWGTWSELLAHTAEVWHR